MVLLSGTRSLLLAQERTVSDGSPAGNGKPASPNSSEKSPANPGSHATLLKGDFLYLPDAKGNLTPVPMNAELQEFLDWKNRNTQPPQQPAFTFSNISLEGIASEDEVTLSVSISVQITDAKTAVRVPLALNEAVLRKFQHKYIPANPPSEKSIPKNLASFGGFDRRSGHHWWLNGVGQHELVLEMIAPLRKTTGVRRLQLAVPLAASSYLRLNIPIAKERLALETVAGGSHKTASAGKEATRLEVFRLGQKVDLGWRALPDSRQVKTLLQAETELRVEPTEESILLKARQLIEPLQGSFKEIEVTLPKGFSVVELKVDGERYRPLEDFPKPPKPIKILLPAATTNRVRLDWILQSPWPESAQLVVEGFHVDQTLRQSGEIAIVGFDGYRIVKRSSTDVYRTNVRELLGPGAISRAYKFYQQPFQLVLELQEIKPSYSVRPLLFVKMGQQEIELLADLELEVYRGVLQSLEIDWPQFSQQGWTTDQTELPGVVEQIQTNPETGKITFHWAKRLTQGTKLRLLLRAKRPVEPNAGPNGFPLTIPRVLAANPVRSVVVVTHQENTESNIQPQEGTATQPLSANLAEQVESMLKQPRMRDIRGRGQTGFLVRSDQQAFQVRLISHSQSIECQSRVFVTTTTEQTLVQQTLAYKVEYEPVSQLRVLVPLSFPENVQFSMGPVPLTFEWTGLKVGDSRQARLTLPEPKLHQFELSASYSVPNHTSSKHRLNIPLVRSHDAKQLAGRLEFSSEDPTEVRVEEDPWKPQPGQSSDQIWASDQFGESVTLAWTDRQESEVQQLKISKALIRSAVLQNGEISSEAYYLLSENLASVLISLPPDQIVPDAFFWKGVELSESQVNEIRPGSGIFRLELAAMEQSALPANANPLLKVAFHAKKASPLNWTQNFELPSPTFPGQGWVDNTIWEISLPVDQHLFTLPAGFTPEFSWTRHGLFWGRTPTQSQSALENWIGLSQQGNSEAFLFEGNTYRFRYFGPTPSLTFSSMNRSMVVLFGAGLALLSGVLLLKFPATRNVITALLAVFAFALCSIWFGDSMQLLLQPAVLGFLLAIAALVIDGSFNRQPAAQPGTLPPGNGYPGSSTGPAYLDPIGSEDPTAVRPAPAEDEDPHSTATHQQAPKQASEGVLDSELIGTSSSVSSSGSHLDSHSGTEKPE